MKHTFTYKYSVRMYIHTDRPERTSLELSKKEKQKRFRELLCRQQAFRCPILPSARLASSIHLDRYGSIAKPRSKGSRGTLLPRLGRSYLPSLHLHIDIDTDVRLRTNEATCRFSSWLGVFRFSSLALGDSRVCLRWDLSARL